MNKLYIMSYQDSDKKNYFKIGVTLDIKSRLRTAQTSCPYKIKVLYLEDRKDAYKIEKKLLKNYKEYRMEGEWISDVTFENIRKTIFELSL